MGIYPRILRLIGLSWEYTHAGGGGAGPPRGPGGGGAGRHLLGRPAVPRAARPGRQAGTRGVSPLQTHHQRGQQRGAAGTHAAHLQARRPGAHPPRTVARKIR
eukprot:6263306-Pyramimonas_sp.AAC.1